MRPFFGRRVDLAQGGGGKGRAVLARGFRFARSSPNAVQPRRDLTHSRDRIRAAEQLQRRSARATPEALLPPRLSFDWVSFHPRSRTRVSPSGYRRIDLNRGIAPPTIPE